jgi:predicted DNA-binding transcriptional regulator AlpA
VPAEWTDRTIRGPDAEYLTADEMRRLFGLPADWFDKRVEDGTIPPPIRLSAKTVLYTWEHAVYLALWLKLHGPAATAAAGRGEKNGAG